MQADVSTDKRAKVALMFILFHKSVGGLVARSLFEGKPSNPPITADGAIQSILDQLAQWSSDVRASASDHWLDSFQVQWTTPGC
jgi:hypothetical protein